MGNGQYGINWPDIHFDRRTEVHPTDLRDVAGAASDSEAHAVEHAEEGRSGPKLYINTIIITTLFSMTFSNACCNIRN